MFVNQTDPERALRSALDSLEACLETPLVGGELTSWVDEVQHAWSEAAVQVRKHVAEFHPRQYQQISKVDPELLSRTEKLREEDAEIETECEEFDRLVRRIAERAPKFEPDEEKFASYVARLVDEGLEFITRVRKQKVAVQTWFVEAFTRDCGVAD